MNVKRNIQGLLAAGIMACAIPAWADHTVTVAGLVNLTNYQGALLVITDSPPEASFLMTTHKWVTEGQAFNDLYFKDKPMHLEVLQLDFTNSVVRAKENGVATFYAPQITNFMGATAGKGIVLNNVDFDDALDLYGRINGRTLLVHPDVKQPRLTISADVTNRLEAAGILKNNLQGRGVTIIADGDKFEWMVPTGATNIISPAAIPTRLTPKRPSDASTNAPVDTLPENSIDFIAVDLPQLLGVYQALTAQKWVQDKPLPAIGTFAFHNQTALTKTETLHALDVLLAWHGLKVVNVDDTSFKLVPLAASE
jgi:hypothetical protein